MTTYKLILAYNGISYKGWQIQPGPVKTIQGELNSALYKMGVKDAQTLGSGRTDAGVNALGQVVRLHTLKWKAGTAALLKGLNSLLPLDIEVLSCQECSSEFNPISHAISKTYTYHFSSGGPRQHRIPLGIGPYGQFKESHFCEEAAALFCEMLVGRHDFRNFKCVGTPTKDDIREIFNCKLIRLPFQSIENAPFSALSSSRDHWRFEIEGSGFLKQMVRLLVGSLWKVASKKSTLEEFYEFLSCSRSGHHAAVAPPEGLYLKAVKYPSES